MHCMSRRVCGGNEVDPVCAGLPHEWSVEEYGRLLEIGGATTVGAPLYGMLWHGRDLHNALLPCNASTPANNVDMRISLAVDLAVSQRTILFDGAALTASMSAWQAERSA